MEKQTKPLSDSDLKRVFGGKGSLNMKVLDGGAAPLAEGGEVVVAKCDNCYSGSANTSACDTAGGCP